MAIQILRGSNYIASKGSIELESGQPFYDTATGYLYVGGRGLAGPTGSTVYTSSNSAINAATANQTKNALSISAGPTGAISSIAFNGSTARSVNITYGLEFNSDNSTCNCVVTYKLS